MDKLDLRTPLRPKGRDGWLKSISATPRAIGTSLAGVGAIALASWLIFSADPRVDGPVATIDLTQDNAPTAKLQLPAGASKPEVKAVEAIDGEAVTEPAPARGQPIMTIGSISEETEKLRSSSRMITVPVQNRYEQSALDEQYDETEDEIPTGSISSAASAVKLAAAPARGLTEKTRYGLLPRVSGGRTAAKIYSRPVDTDRAGQLRGRIAIVIGGMGLSSQMTQKAINDLPAEITLAFAPYGSGLARWAKRARTQGHEIMLQMPMEPFNYPRANPGPNTLLTTSTTQENIDRLKSFMGLFTGYTGVINYMGAKFSSDVASLGPVLAEFKRRGVYYLDDGSIGRTKAMEIGEQFNLGVRRADVVIDGIAGAKNTQAALKRLEALAAKRGWAIGMGTALPTTLNEIVKWEETLGKNGLGLVPVTSLY